MHLSQLSSRLYYLPQPTHNKFLKRDKFKRGFVANLSLTKALGINMFSLQQITEFEEMANPHSWFLVASELHEQAKLLREGGTSRITRLDFSGDKGVSWNSSNRTVILLAGFALENIMKAYLIYEHPNFVGNGFLSKTIKTHKLTKLARESSLLPYQSQGLNTLKYYEEGLESWARYPCGLNWAQTKEQNLLSETVWKNYLWLMSAYESRFIKLMLKGWKGPHEFNGAFEITGSFS